MTPEQKQRAQNLLALRHAERGTDLARYQQGVIALLQELIDTPAPVASVPDGLKDAIDWIDDFIAWPHGRRAGEAVAEANARRIVAAVNACAGLPTEALESSNNIVAAAQKMTAFYDALEQQRDKLLAALELVIDRFSPCRDEYIFSKRNALDKASKVLAEVKGQS